MTRTTFPVAVIQLGAAKRALDARAADAVHRVIVDQNANLPATVEIWMVDPSGVLLARSGFSIGQLVTIGAPTGSNGQHQPLITAELTSIAGEYRGLSSHLVLRGYSREHRLQRVRRSRAYLNMKDSDIAREIANSARIPLGTVDESKTAHDHLAQVNETDWEFLHRRAAEIGFELRMVADQFCFQKAPASAGGAAIALSRTHGLWSFRPRITAASLASQVEVRVWNPATRKVVAETTSVVSDFIMLSGQQPSTLASTFASVSAPATSNPPNSAVGELGPAAGDGHVLINRPAGSGAATAGAASELAGALAQRIGSASAEADGDAAGDPRITPGASLSIDGFADIFNGSWVVTSARHVFDVDEGGYRTYFSVHGREDRSLLGLTASGSQPQSQFAGLVCGVVTNNNDPDGHSRIKVALPWLSTDFETDWAPVAQVSAGPSAGALFLPAVGDQVLVGFEFADPRRPYVIASLLTDTSSYDTGGPAIKASGQATQVVRAGFASRTGNLVAFYDDLPPSAGSPPTASQLLLGAKDGKVALTFDQAAGSITVNCAPGTPASKSTSGTITIECGPSGTINIKAGAGGSVNIDGGDRLNLTAASELKLDCKGPVQIKGNPIQLN